VNELSSPPITLAVLEHRDTLKTPKLFYLFDPYNTAEGTVGAPNCFNLRLKSALKNDKRQDFSSKDSIRNVLLISGNLTSRHLVLACATF
jgi:hypothetical protein